MTLETSNDSKPKPHETAFVMRVVFDVFKNLATIEKEENEEEPKTNQEEKKKGGEA